jgi:vacuolar-type H+-ATPase subunit I/STV1
VNPRRRRVLDRVTALRRAAPPDIAELDQSPEPDDASDEELLRDLRVRIQRLEQAFEGLQDAVHRESQRRDEEIAALRRQVQPEAMARSLSDDARRGL